MSGPDYSRNDAFLDDADFVFSSMAARKALAQLVGKLAGRGRRRRAAYPEIREFMEDFQKLPYGNAKRGNEQLTDMLKFVTAGRIDWPIAPFLAWLCYYHRDEAIAFYASVGLTAKFNVRFRQYVGRPGDRAKMARGVLRPTVIPEFIPSGPPNKVSASRGNDQLPNNLTMEVGPFAQGETDLMGESISKEIETKRLDLKNKVSVRARGVIFGGDLGAAGGGACPTTSSFDLGGHRAHR